MYDCDCDESEYTEAERELLTERVIGALLMEVGEKARGIHGLRQFTKGRKRVREIRLDRAVSRLDESARRELVDRVHQIWDRLSQYDHLRRQCLRCNCHLPNF